MLEVSFGCRSRSENSGGIWSNDATDKKAYVVTSTSKVVNDHIKVDAR